MKRIITVLTLLLVMGMPIGIVSANLNDGLVAHYPFNGNSYDESGNGNHGTVCVATLTTDRFELPRGGNVVNGSASFDYSVSKNLIIDQQTDRVVIDWDSFNIGKKTTTEFRQQSSRSLAVIRVAGASTDPTQILGTLKSNGQVMVLDRNGVFFGANSSVDVGGIIASAGSIDVNQVMSGANNIDIVNATGGPVVNEGQITANDGGLVALVAPHVANSGIITANIGRVELASGGTVTVDLYGDKLAELEVNGELANSFVENSGTIEANGGRVALTAKAAQGVVNDIINMSGIVKADSFSGENGRIVLKGNNNGIVRVSGTMSARADDGVGGYIEVTGNQVVNAYNRHVRFVRRR